MKIFKKILAGVVSAAVIVSALAVPTAALTATPKTDSKSGTFKVGSMTYSYGGTLTATNKQATVSVSSGCSMKLYANVEATATYQGKSVTNYTEDVISDTIVTVSVDNTFTTSDGKKTLDIVKATSICKVGTIATFDLKVE